MPPLKRLLPTLTLIAVAAGLAAPVAALASTTQQSIIEDDTQLHANLDGTLQTMRELGATEVKVAVYWSTLAPQARSFKRPKGFDGSDPAAYPATSWSFYDDVVQQAKADGLQVGFMLTGPAPLWATGKGMPHTNNCPCAQWKPSAADFEEFVHAVGERYDGSYTPAGASAPLPRVSWWSIWNEPNYGPNLAPQATDDNTVYTGASMYRGLLDAAWKGLGATGHKPGRDTIVFGETAPRGVQRRGYPGNFSGTVPLIFVESLYCEDTGGHKLAGKLAKASGCPTTAAASKKFRAQNPALFKASGYADHPYEQGTPPNLPTYACTVRGTNTFCSNKKTRKSDPYYADLPEIPRLERVLDRLNSAYGSHTKFPIWNTEYGFWSHPPDDQPYSLPQATAAEYMNWAEYLSYKQPRIASYDQYLLVDEPDGDWASGLEQADGTLTQSYAAFQLPPYIAKHLP